MKITQLRAVQPATPGSPPDWRTQLGQIVVEVTTDEGVTGIGVGGGGLAGIHIIETVLRDLLIGQDPTDVEAWHSEMCRHTAFYGQKGLVVMAISGVDLALWDLRGKLLGQPVARLLNEGVDLAQPLPTYRTVFDDVETEAALDAGHAAVKLHVERFGDRPDPTAIAELVERARNKLGSERALMIDAFGRWDIPSTMAVAAAIEPYQLDWLEEPLSCDDLAGYEALKQSPVPIAGGEHEYLISGFETLAREQLHTVLQPDINWCGGMTTLVQIYQLAAQTGLRVCPHRGSEVYALHAIAAIDPQPLAESPRNWFNVLQGSPAIENGMIQLTDAPGFGINVAADLWPAN